MNRLTRRFFLFLQPQQLLVLHAHQLRNAGLHRAPVLVLRTRECVMLETVCSVKRIQLHPMSPSNARTSS